jgi:diaminopimelate epimerase
MHIEFSKMHGLGNDFIIINNLELKHQFTAPQIRYLADRKFGIGCDQLLIVNPANDGISDFYYQIYNSDGSEAGQCGNGARCFIRYLIKHKLTPKTILKLQTTNRIIQGKLLSNDLIEVSMGVPQFQPHCIPLNLLFSDNYILNFNNQLLTFYALSMSNPHAIIKLDCLSLFNDDNYLTQIAQHLQSSSLFPDSVNVNFVYINSRKQIQLRTYERGCGFTLACGSGACASVVALIQANFLDNQVVVQMRGGNLTINWQGNFHEVIMQGSATHVFCGNIELCN